MFGFVAQKLNEFENGKISRRRLIETLTLAATATAASTGANAQGADPTLKVALVNHVSYTCPNFQQAADWYSKVFNLDQVGPSKRDVALPFGKKGEKPLGVTAEDVPLPHLIIRSRDLNAAPQPGQPVRPKPQAVIDHIALTIADFNRDKAKAELIAMGVKNVREAGMHSLHMDDAFGFDVQISGIEANALTDG
jgi:catechol 2,3-dioxygenase-like lactoylglutathione lyase family enzyme